MEKEILVHEVQCTEVVRTEQLGRGSRGSGR